MIGRTVARYRILEKLGEGGMGVVYKALDERLRRHVAVKALPSDAAADPDRVRRLLREARAASALAHPGLVTVHDILNHEGQDLIVMELVPGEPLRQRISSDGLSWETAIEIALPLAEAVAAAHGAGILHRDLKPSNIMVLPNGGAHAPVRIKVLDFGLATPDPGSSSEEDAETFVRLTKDGVRIGTPAYMSPEQSLGERLGSRTDVFSFGIVLYEMLVGRRPFWGAKPEQLVQALLFADPKPLDEIHSDIPEGLARLVDKILSKEPDGRPSMAEVAETLRRLQRPRPAATVDTGLTAGLQTLVLADLVEATLSGFESDAPGADFGSEMHRLLEPWGGREATIGDRFVLLFSRPGDAVGFALDCHRLAAKHRMESRLAIHLGATVPAPDSREDALRFELEAPILALLRSLMDLAENRQTLLGRAAFDLARVTRASSQESAVEHAEWLAHGAYLLRGFDEPVEVFEVGERNLAPLRPPPGTEFAAPAPDGGGVILGWRPAPGLEIGQRPNWHAERRLGEGGFGEVWLARHKKTGEARAFKFCWEAEHLLSLRREVLVFRLLKEELGERDDIARILDWNFDEAPYFIESAYTEGGNLVDWARQQGGLDAVPLADRLEIAAQVATALAAAHSVGVLHKDVKPSNVLMRRPRDSGSRAVLADFGIGRIIDRERLAAQSFTLLGATEMDKSQETSGTPLYMAPEVLAGRRPTVQSDIYALGVVLYQMVVADFERPLAAGWERRVDGELLREDIAAAIDGNPERRPQSATEMAEKLRALEARRAERAAERAAAAAARRASRRRRVLALVAAIASVFLMVVSILAVQATRARHEAEQNRARAEQLIDVMLGDLHQGLEKIGRLDLLETAARGSQAYFDALQDTSEESAEVVVQRGQTLQNVGDVLFEGDDLPRARAAFEAARDLFAAELARRPGNDDARAGLHRSVLSLGRALRHAGENAASLTLLGEALTIAQERAAVASDDPRRRLALAYNHFEICKIQIHIGDDAAARSACSTALELLTSRPSDPDVTAERNPWQQYDLELRVRIELGYLLRSDGQSKAALEEFLLAAQLARRLIEQDPNHAIWPRRLAGIDFQIGFIRYRYESDLQGAEEALDRARDAYRRLVILDPERSQWQVNLSQSLNYLGRVHLARGEHQAAKLLFEEAVDPFEKLAEEDPERLTWHRWRASLYQSMGRAALTLDDTAAACEGFRAALDLYLELAATGDDPDPWNNVGWAYVLLGRAQLRHGDEEEARNSWTRAAGIMAPITARSEDVQFLDTHAQALLELGQAEAARPLVEKLLAKGWNNSEFVAGVRRVGLGHLLSEAVPRDPP